MYGESRIFESNIASDAYIRYNMSKKMCAEDVRMCSAGDIIQQLKIVVTSFLRKPAAEKDGGSEIEKGIRNDHDFDGTGGSGICGRRRTVAGGAD